MTPNEVSPRQAGDFERFFTEHRNPVLALVYTLSGDRSLAEDIAQEAFTEAFRRWDHISSYDNPGAWVRRVAVNRSVSRFRRRSNEVKALIRINALRVVQPEMSVEDDSFWQKVRALPRRQAQAVALFYLEDRSVQEIAEVLGIAPSTVKVNLHRGRRALAQTLGVDAEEERA